MDKKLFRTGPYADFFSQGVQVGNVLTLAGQLGDTEDGSCLLYTSPSPRDRG